MLLLLIMIIITSKTIANNSKHNLPTLELIAKQNLHNHNAIVLGFQHVLLEGEKYYGPIHVKILKIKNGATDIKTIDTCDCKTTMIIKL